MHRQSRRRPPPTVVDTLGTHPEGPASLLVVIVLVVVPDDATVLPVTATKCSGRLSNALRPNVPTRCMASSRVGQGRLTRKVRRALTF